MTDPPTPMPRPQDPPGPPPHPAIRERLVTDRCGGRDRAVAAGRAVGDRSAAVSRVDLTEIAEKWLRQCAAHDAGLAMSCTCPEGDPRNVISNLADEVLRLRIQIATAEDEKALTWSLPPEPGPEVTALRDQDGDLWVRDPDGCWRQDSGSAHMAWHDVLNEWGPLTDASAEATP